MSLLTKEQVTKTGVGDITRLPEILQLRRTDKYFDYNDEDFQLGLKYGYLLAIKDYEKTSIYNNMCNQFLATFQSFEQRISDIERRHENEDDYIQEKNE